MLFLFPFHRSSPFIVQDMSLFDLDFKVTAQIAITEPATDSGRSPTSIGGCPKILLLMMMPYLLKFYYPFQLEPWKGLTIGESYGLIIGHELQTRASL